MGAIYGARARRRLLGGVGHRLGRRPLLHPLRAASARAAPPSSTRASRSARPMPGAFWRVSADHGVDVLFTAPTAIRAIKREDPGGEHMRDHDLSRLRTLFLAGERCDPDTLAWAERSLDRPVIDHWWQTETGWPIAANCVGLERLPVKPGSAAKAVPGYDLRVLDDHGNQVPAGEIGALCLKLPLPPGCSPTLWGGDEHWVEAYLSQYAGYYLTARRGLHRRRRLRVRHEPDRRRHQHRRPPALHRRDGGGARRPPGCRRVRGRRDRR